MSTNNPFSMVRFQGMSAHQIGQLLSLDYPSKSSEVQLLLTMMANHILAWHDANTEGDTVTMSRMLRDCLATSKQLNALSERDEANQDITDLLSTGGV